MIQGGSKELGCLQYRESSFDQYSKEILGYVAPFDSANQQYVAVKKIEQWEHNGNTPKQILLFWNAGENATKCGKGKNKLGVKYNSCAYVSNGIKFINNFIAYANN